jgi:Bacterial capsule synthesis protein PGA_cap
VIDFQEMPNSILIGGDVWPAAIQGEELRARLGVADAPDLFVFTLDSALPAGPRRDNYTCIEFDANNLSALRLGNQNLAVTASNHITDFGDAGVIATLDELARHGFSQVGAGANRAQADQAAIVELSAGRAAVLAFAETTPRVRGLAAQENSAGVRPLEPPAVLAAIARAKSEADWVWVVLHWGDEFIRYPDPQQRSLARAMIDSGADLVVASHTHVPLGHERYGGGSIFYGLGNLIYPPYIEQRGFTYRWNPTSRQGVVVRGRHDGHVWSWTPEEIRHDARGIPRLSLLGLKARMRNRRRPGSDQVAEVKP